MEEQSTYCSIKLSDLDTSLSVFRLIRPDQINSMARSIERLGQLHPVIVRESKNTFQLIDGFKRYYAAEQLHIDYLYANTVDATAALSKAMILNYNRTSNSLIDYEEAMVVYSLKTDHLMNQKDISQLLGCSGSWVCRRLSLIERLDKSVQTQLRFGKITPAHAREIVKLPRGKQESITQSIIDNNVTSRQSIVLIEKYLKSSSKRERDYLLRCPVEAIEMAEKEKEPYDCRLSKHGNRLLKSIEMLITQQHIFIGQFKDHQTKQLTDNELTILTPRLKKLSGKSNTIGLIINKNV